MKNKLLLISLLLFFGFCFVVLFKGLNNPNAYVPEKTVGKTIANFTARDLYTEKEISFDEIFIDSKFYVLNIWASWCFPCRTEHSKLMKLSKNKSLKLIGINYRDNTKNAKKYINEFGNPYSNILTDKEGIISIELGAYGIPETIIINQDKKILKKFIGPLDDQLIEEINLIVK